MFKGIYGGNIVLVASHRRLDRTTLERLVSRHGDVLAEDAALDSFIGNAPVIRDDYVAIDQWLDADKS